MTERSRGEVVREVFMAARREEVATVVDVLKNRTLPHFRGDFRAMVTALQEGNNGPSYQGSQPTIWNSIQIIDQRLPFLGSALTVVAITEDIEPPPCGLMERGLDKMTYNPG